MSLATISRHWYASLSTRTVQQFCRAIFFALFAIAVGLVIYVIEKYLLQLDRRFVENPASVMMRACGLAHFWIGWLFLFTSPRLHNGPALRRLGFLTGIGIALCLLSAWIGSEQNPLFFVLFYGYFLVHDVRDQANLYQAYGDAPVNDATTKQFLQTVATATVVVLTTILSFGFILHSKFVKPKEYLADIPLPVYALIGSAMLCTSLYYVRRAWMAAVLFYGSPLEAFRRHAPILVIYASIAAILGIGMLFGSLSFNLIILIHAGTWLVFVTYQLSQKPAPEKKTLWNWLRHTPVGFVTLHLIVIGIVVLCMALRVHAWQRVGLLSELFANSSFPYWSLMHISMAFWKPPRG